MSDDFEQDRTEAPTPRRRQEARRDGNVARSGDLAAAAVLVGMLLAMRWLAPGMIESWRQIALLSLDAGAGVTPAGLPELLWSIAGHATAGVLPLLVAAFGLSLAASLGQVGFLFVPRKASPSFEALDPARGFSRIFGSSRSYVGLLLNLAKLALAGVVAWLAIKAEMPRIVTLPALPIAPAAAGGAAVVFAITLKVALALLVLGVVDYGYQRWSHGRQLRMTRQQVKDELKRTEGDPDLKARRRRHPPRVVAVATLPRGELTAGRASAANRT